jgi:hypothetical protein
MLGKLRYASLRGVTSHDPEAVREDGLDRGNPAGMNWRAVSRERVRNKKDLDLVFFYSDPSFGI